jgi:hypothetical protein
MACTLNDLIPRICEKNVGMLAVSLTETSFTGRQPGIVARQLVVTFSVTATFEILLNPAAEVPYCCATCVALVGSGSCCAPARADASAADWRARWVR